MSLLTVVVSCDAVLCTAASGSTGTARGAAAGTMGTAAAANLPALFVLRGVLVSLNG